MSVMLFFGPLLGGLLGITVRDHRTAFCCYMLEKHPTLTKAIGLTLLGGLILIPTLALTGVLVIPTTPFFWGGILTCSFIYGFFVGSCVCTPEVQE